MDGKNSERDIWLTYCEDCVKSKIDKNVPQEFEDELREDTNL